MLSFASPSSSSPNWQMSMLAAAAAARASGTSRVASTILPRLYLSDYFTARNPEELARLGVTHVVSVMEEVPVLPGPLQTLHIAIADRADTDILSHLARTTEYIRAALADERGVVLVHCLMGMSRSATVVCAYLCATFGMVAHDAITFVRQRRSIICPNAGFQRQLETYATQFCVPGTKAVSGKGAGRKISAGVAEQIRRLKSGGRAPSGIEDDSAGKENAVVS